MFERALSDPTLQAGAFYVFPSARALGHAVNDRAQRIVDYARVVTVPGTAFGSSGDGYLRLCCAVATTSLEQALIGIAEAVCHL